MMIKSGLAYMQSQIIAVAALLVLVAGYVVGILYGGQWAKGARYRKLATEFHDKAKTALTREGAKELYELADHYSSLAEQADRMSFH